MQFVASVAFGYLVGSIPLGLIVARLWNGVDIRTVGTGNIGASNTFHNVGLAPAAVVGFGGFLQGFVPAWVAFWLTSSLACLVLAGVGAVVGYGWSLFLHFRGGSAVATATGALAAISPPSLVPLLVFYAIGGALRQPALGVLAGLLAFLVFLIGRGAPAAALLGSGLIAALVVLRRLDGVGEDLRGPHPGAVLIDRLLFDRRPGRHLVGPIE